MNGWYLAALLVSFGLTAGLTPLMARLARRFGAVDHPESAPARKWHTQPIPLLGGLAIILGSVGTWWVMYFAGVMIRPDFPLKYLIGISLAAGLIALGGALDDRWRLSPGRQLVWPILAVLVVVAVGVGVDFITNPFGGLLYLNQVQIQLFQWQDLPYYLTLWADLFTFVWVLGMMYTTKILDGLDGLVSGLGLIGAVIVFLLTLRPEVNQPSVGLLVLGLAGACLGFLIYNWHPAKIFLGEGGSLYIGFILGITAIISGGKIATALLILGLPILDLAWVIIQRQWRDGRSPFRTADRRHLHFRLTDAGLSVRQTVLILYAITIAFGLSTLWFHGATKVWALATIGTVLVLLAAWASRRDRQRGPANSQKS